MGWLANSNTLWAHSTCVSDHPSAFPDWISADGAQLVSEAVRVMELRAGRPRTAQRTALLVMLPRTEQWVHNAQVLYIEQKGAAQNVYVSLIEGADHG
jgi:hypothetical protein